jgi:hypothetical protein
MLAFNAPAFPALIGRRFSLLDCRMFAVCPSNLLLSHCHLLLAHRLFEAAWALFRVKRWDLDGSFVSFFITFDHY